MSVDWSLGFLYLIWFPQKYNYVFHPPTEHGHGDSHSAYRRTYRSDCLIAYLTAYMTIFIRTGVMKDSTNAAKKSSGITIVTNLMPSPLAVSAASPLP